MARKRNRLGQFMKSKKKKKAPKKRKTSKKRRKTSKRRSRR